MLLRNTHSIEIFFLKLLCWCDGKTQITASPKPESQVGLLYNMHMECGWQDRLHASEQRNWRVDSRIFVLLVILTLNL